MYFSSDRAAVGQIHVSTFDGTSFGTPVLAPGLEGQELSSPFISADELELFVSASNGLGGLAIGRTVRSSLVDPWGPVTLVSELNMGGDNGWVSLTPDELTIYFERSGTTRDIYRATRAVRGAPFGAATLVPELTSAQNDGDPDVSRDGRTIMFSSDRNGATGFDIYTASCND